MIILALSPAWIWISIFIFIITFCLIGGCVMANDDQKEWDNMTPEQKQKRIREINKSNISY